MVQDTVLKKIKRKKKSRVYSNRENKSRSVWVLQREGDNNFSFTSVAYPCRLYLESGRGFPHLCDNSYYLSTSHRADVVLQFCFSCSFFLPGPLGNHCSKHRAAYTHTHTWWGPVPALNRVGDREHLWIRCLLHHKRSLHARGFPPRLCLSTLRRSLNSKFNSREGGFSQAQASVQMADRRSCSSSSLLALAKALCLRLKAVCSSLEFCPMLFGLFCGTPSQKRRMNNMFCIFKSATVLWKSSLSWAMTPLPQLMAYRSNVLLLRGPQVVAALAPSQHHTWKTRGDQDDVVKEEDQGEVHWEVKLTSVEIYGESQLWHPLNCGLALGSCWDSKAVRASLLHLFQPAPSGGISPQGFWTPSPPSTLAGETASVRFSLTDAPTHISGPVWCCVIPDSLGKPQLQWVFAFEAIQNNDFQCTSMHYKRAIMWAKEVISSLEQQVNIWSLTRFLVSWTRSSRLAFSPIFFFLFSIHSPTG